MDKEELLLKNYAILSKNPGRNQDALKSAIKQLLESNPKLGMRCWEECIQSNLSKIKPDFGKTEFEYDSVGYVLIYDYESDFCSKDFFEHALEIYAKNKALLDIIYTKSPISTYFGAPYAISYLIRKDRLQEADNILSAICKNKLFSEYSHLWGEITEKFKYGDTYSPGGLYLSKPLTQPEHIRDFCMRWIERIKDEEEQAGAMTFAMRMF